MKRINLLYLAWIAVVIFLYAKRDWFQVKNADYFYGTAEAEGFAVSLEDPVEVLRLAVRPGQAVKKGELLAEVSRSSLSLSLLEKQFQLEKLRLENLAARQSLEAEIRQVNAQSATLASEFGSQIRELGAEEGLQKVLREQVLGAAAADSVANSRAVRIEGLWEQLELEKQALRSQAQALERQLEATRRQYELERRQAAEELALLEKEKEKLAVYAPAEGIVSQIHFSQGEIAPAFAEIMRIFPLKATFIKGYLHESAPLQLAPGDSLRVVSFARPEIHATGVVTGIGSNIVEFPQRIRKYPEIKVWGREAYISLPESADFPVMEKVIIETGNPPGK